jgi:hypothetical protein
VITGRLGRGKTKVSVSFRAFLARNGNHGCWSLVMLWMHSNIPKGATGGRDPFPTTAFIFSKERRVWSVDNVITINIRQM